MGEQPYYTNLLTRTFFEKNYIEKRMSYPQIQKMLKEQGYNIHPGTLYKYAKKYNIGRNSSEAKRIKDPYSLDYNKTYITNGMVSYLDGFLLGDGGIQFSRNTPDNHVARLSLGVEFEEFAKYLLYHFKNLGVKIKKRYTDKMNQGFIFSCSTRFHPDIYKQYIRWYPETNGKYRTKQPPEDVRITPKSVMAWYLGDGSLVIKEKTIVVRLATDGFLPEKNIMLSNKLREKGIRCHRNKFNRIFIEARGVPAFFNFIGRESPISPIYDHKFNLPFWRFESKRMKEVSDELNINYERLSYLVKKNKIPCFRLSLKGRPRFLPKHIKKIKGLIKSGELY